MNGGRWPLSPRAARVFYGLADAWIPPRDGAPGGGDRDVVAALASELRSSGERRRLERMLWLLEWSPRLLLRSMRGLAWMERDARRAWLERAEHCRSRRVREAMRALHRLVDATRASSPRSAATRSAGEEREAGDRDT